MKGISDVKDAGIPALPASAALPIIIVSGASAGRGRYRRSGKSFTLDRGIEVVCTNADREVVGDVAGVIQHNLLFLGWQPMLDCGGLAANLHDLVEMGYILEVAAIMPPEVARLLTGKIIEKECHGINPMRIPEGCEATLHGIDDIGEVV